MPLTAHSKLWRAKAILQAAATFSMSEAGSVAEEWQRKLAGGVYQSSAEVIHKERAR